MKKNKPENAENRYLTKYEKRILRLETILENIVRDSVETLEDKLVDIGYTKTKGDGSYLGMYITKIARGDREIYFGICDKILDFYLRLKEEIKLNKEFNNAKDK